MTHEINLRTAIITFVLSMQADGFADKTVSWYRWLLDESPNSVIHWLFNNRLYYVRHITTNDLRLYLVWLQKQPNSRTGDPQSEFTINGYRRALHRFFAWCATEYSVPNPMARIAYPKMPDSAPKAIEIDDVVKMFHCCPDDERGRRNRALLAFLLDTGARAQGICGLTRELLDLKEHKALVTEKGSRTRPVIFTSRTAALLSEWLEVHRAVPPLFYNVRTGNPLTTDGLAKILKALARQAGVTGRVNPHSFRHAFARGYILNGGDLATLAKLMGHRQVSTTVGFYTLFTDAEIAAKHEQYSPARLLQ
jgi:integrase/recombinase XerD